VAYLMTGNNPGFAPNAFAVVDRTCATGYYSFGHELGHNMGLHHNRDDAVGTGAYSYSYGYRWPGYRTVMAYAPGTRILHFSNPNVLYLGNPTGVIETSPNAAAHNALSLNNTRVTVANWRVADTPTLTVVTPNGGEWWPIGSVQTISWTSAALSANATIRLSYTNGSTTYAIANGLAPTATAYAWTVPNTPATNWRVVVCSDVSGSCEATDQSDAPFTVSCPILAISPAAIPSGTPGVPYAVTFTQTSGTPPITWSLSGALPAGIGFTPATATLAGTPTVTGSFPLTIAATGAGGCQGALLSTLVINRANPFVPTALVVDSTGNSVLEVGESAVAVAPSWRNDTGSAAAVTANASAFWGPGAPDPTYTVADAAAGYGSVPAGATASCTGTGNCYALSLGTPTRRPVRHWDANFLESLSSGDAKSWALHVGESFDDVPKTNPFYRFVETLVHRAVTGGCSASTYCPDSTTSREQMAVFALVAKQGAGYSPAACGTVPLFADVPASSPFCRWIEELSRRGVVGGCGGGNYCPSSPVLREQMAIFMLRTLDPALSPPACATPAFADVPASSPFCPWIEELARRGVVSGCGGGNYCPTSPVTRGQMGVFIAVTFGLTLYGP
jgi:hypothetical protein